MAGSRLGQILLALGLDVSYSLSLRSSFQNSVSIVQSCSLLLR